MILVVDDDPLLLNLICRIVAEEGLPALPATSAREALQFFERDGAGIKLLVTDIVMPDMTGGELARAVRAKRADLPVLFISGFCDAGPLPERSAFLAKPFSPPKLREAIRRLLPKNGD